MSVFLSPFFSESKDREIVVACAMAMTFCQFIMLIFNMTTLIGIHKDNFRRDLRARTMQRTSFLNKKRKRRGINIEVGGDAQKEEPVSMNPFTRMGSKVKDF